MTFSEGVSMKISVDLHAATTSQLQRKHPFIKTKDKLIFLNPQQLHKHHFIFP